MITVQLGTVLVLLAGVPLLVTAVLALCCNFRGLHRPARESIYECSRCGHVYAFARNRPLDRCPRCGHLNEAVRNQAAAR